MEEKCPVTCGPMAFARKRLAVWIVTSILLLAVGCEEEGQHKKIRLSAGGKSDSGLPAVERSVPLRVAVAPVISPRENFKLYDPLLRYISRKTDRPVDFIQRRTYAEINELVRYGRADVAFVCDYAYVEGERDFGMQILVVPVVMGKKTYHSYIIVPKDSAARTLYDLRGKGFAFSDPLSSSGWLFPTHLLRRVGEAPESFFKRHVFTYSHDNTVKAVAEKLVDGGAVDSLVYEFMLSRDPKYAEHTKVIHKSEPWGNPPVAVHPRIGPALRDRLKQVFLTMHDDEEGRRVLAPLMINQFILPDGRSYDEVRKMAAVVRDRR